MPYGSDEKSKAYWNRFYHLGILGLKPLIQGRGYSLNFLRAQEMPTALQLKESVKRLIDRSQICLGIITGLNPNVFWEIGYAESKGKPIVLLVADGVNETQYSPVLVAEVLKMTYDGNIFDDDPPQDASLVDFQQNLIPFFDIAVNIAKATGKPAVQYTIFADRLQSNLPGAIATAQRTIDLITTNLSFYADFDNFVHETVGKISYAFDPPIERGVRVRVLILDPESVIAEYRAKQLGREHEVYEYRNQLRRFATAFYHRYIDKENVDIRIYDDLPSQITLLIDDRVITSFLSRGQQARFNIHAEFSKDCKGVHETFEKNFAEVLANEKHTTHISHFKWAQRK